MEIKEFIRIAVEEDGETVRIHGQFTVPASGTIKEDHPVGIIKEIKEDGTCLVEI